MFFHRHTEHAIGSSAAGIFQPGEAAALLLGALVTIGVVSIVAIGLTRSRAEAEKHEVAPRRKSSEGSTDKQTFEEVNHHLVIR